MNGIAVWQYTMITQSGIGQDVAWGPFFPDLVSIPCSGYLKPSKFSSFISSYKNLIFTYPYNICMHTQRSHITYRAYQMFTL